MKKLFLFALVGLVAGSILAACSSKPKWERFKDGVQILLEVETKENQSVDRANTLKAVEILGKRMDDFGVKERIIQMQGERRIAVQLPGAVDPQRAAQLIGRTGTLEFKILDEENNLEDALKGKIPEGSEILYEASSPDGGEAKRPFLIKRPALLTGDLLTKVKVQIDTRFNEPYISLELNDAGAKLFEKITSENVNRRLAIILDNTVYSTPVIREKISGGHAQIAGRFTMEEAKELAAILKAGALPAPVRVIESKRLTREMWLGEN
jgi:preprotein translocase subunit SecD